MEEEELGQQNRIVVSRKVIHGIAMIIGVSWLHGVVYRFYREISFVL